MKAHPKVSHLLWRVVNDCIPSRQNLLCCRIMDGAVYPRYHGAIEYVLYVFRDCNFCNRFWTKLGIPKSAWNF
ncbi:hypothetical protein ACFX19_046273 [Malus domestica]